MHTMCSNRLTSRTVAYPLIASLCAAMPSEALASPLDDFVTRMVTDPATCFLTGAGAGAILAGLTVGLVERGARRHLQAQLTDTMNAVVRAEGAARRAEAALREMELESGMVDGKPFDPLSYVGDEHLDTVEDYGLDESTHAYDTARENGFDSPYQTSYANPYETGSVAASPQESPYAEQPRQAQVSQASQARTRRTAAGVTGAHLRVDSEPRQQTSGRMSRRERENGHTVADMLRERLSRTTNDMFVIERAPALADTAPRVYAHMPQPKAERQFDPVRRARAIDRRVPRFDESLFPDVTQDHAQMDDPFSVAMRAMDSKITPAPVVADVPKITAAESSHVDDLVREELEINRSGAGRRFSRSQLTMIDGGEDEGRSRRGGRHFSYVREAK